MWKTARFASNMLIKKKAKARPREFKQPFYPDAASQLMLAGVGTLVSLSSEEAVRQHEKGHDLPRFDQAFAVRCAMPCHADALRAHAGVYSMCAERRISRSRTFFLSFVLSFSWLGNNYPHKS